MKGFGGNGEGGEGVPA